jgi:Xaa-Pro aminopeptidase
MKRSSGPHVIEDVRPLLGELRVIKNEYEISCLRKAIDITCEAHKAVLSHAEPGMYEYEIEGLIEYTYRQQGTQEIAFPSIVASGPNATILHYSINDRKVEPGDLILMDIGASYKHYAADVTRTIPVSGKFSKEQLEIYSIVLQAQKAAIETVKPGTGLRTLNERIIHVGSKGLFELGLISDVSSKWQMRVWQMHGTSHWLGLDVHDDGPYDFKESKGLVLEPGMVFTIEPGIYISRNVLENLDILFPHIPQAERDGFIEFIRPALEKYLDIGIRIEDDILVTDHGYEVLSSSAPKEVDEIEDLMK